MITIRRYRSVLRSPARLFLAFIAATILVASRGSGPLGLLQAEDNPILAENAKIGDTDWDISGSGHASIQGFATDMSVNVGATINFKIDTPASDYRLDIYRLGYYSGAGARKVATVQPSAALPQSQPSCLSNSATTGLVDCGNWGVSASWPVPGTAVSGIYIAKPTREDGANIGKASHIVFVVRNDALQADILFQTSDTTWQAYNSYGGNSLYCGGPLSNAGSAYGCASRSAKVSYNRPFNTRVSSTPSWVFNAEYPMVRWLEAHGFNVKYWSGVDTDRFGADPTYGLPSATKKPKVFLSVGHDESGRRAATNVENARNAGVNRVHERQRNLLEDALGVEHVRWYPIARWSATKTRFTHPAKRSTPNVTTSTARLRLARRDGAGPRPPCSARSGPSTRARLPSRCPVR